MKLVGKVFILVLGVLGSTFAVAQNLSQHNWYFGNTQSAIRFNRTDNTPSLINTKAIPFGAGGSAVATDPATGNMLFYADANNVFNVSNGFMTNGTGLLGTATANQPVAICAVPGDPNKYFIFTNTANFTAGGTIRYSVVDMAAAGGSPFPAPPFGAVVALQKNQPTGLTTRSEGMIIVPHANGTDFWLISHQVNSNTYSANLINAASLASGLFPAAPPSNPGLYPTTVANFSYYAKTKKLAVSPQDSNTDALILTFDDATGAMVIDRYILNSGIAVTGTQSIYDIEWDRKGQYLYISRTGEAGVTAEVLQYDYLNPSFSLKSVLTTPVFRSYGLQFAPDSSLYYIYQRTSATPLSMDTFTKTDTIASEVIRNTTPLGSIDVKGRQFPVFLPKAKVNFILSFTAAGFCQNSPTAFYPSIQPNADSVHWVFGDGADTTAWSPLHTYPQPNTYSVTLTAFFHGDKASVTQPVTINPFPLTLDLVQDTTACKDEFPPPRGTTPKPGSFSVKVKVSGGTAQTFNWFPTGETTDTVHPDSAGYYYVVVGDGSGCSAYAGVNVKEYGLQDQRRNIWYFGDHAGIDFNPPTPVALDNSAMDAPEGCAIMCDRNGKTIFYTDGDNVYDRNNGFITNGLGGNPLSTQSSLIFPVPGDETLYYIFTTEAIDGTSAFNAYYSLFDMKQNSGLGLITIKKQLLFSKSTERVTADTQWVIFHEYGNNTFRAYPITANGIGGPVYSAIGSDHAFQFPTNDEGYMKLGGRNNLAVALSNPGVSNLIELFDFSDSTGLVTNYRKIDLKEPNGQVYGIEISEGGNKLFATVKGAPIANSSKLFEYFIDSVGHPYQRKPARAFTAELGAIQISPNRTLYVAVNSVANSDFLGIINVNEDTTAISPFQLKGFELAAGTTSHLGLPNLRLENGNAFGGPGFTYTGICFGDSTHFVGTPRDVIDSYNWTFGDGGHSTDASPVHLYTSPTTPATTKTFTVTLRLHNRCAPDTTIVQQVTINGPPPFPTNTPAAALCNGSVVLDANTGNLPNTSYSWTNGDTTRVVTITSPIIIQVTNTDKLTGCSSSQVSIVADNRPVVDLGPDVTVCRGAGTLQLNAGNPGANYVWTVPVGITASTTMQQTVDLNSASTTTTPQVYGVTVTDPITTCSVSDQVTFIVKTIPSFTFTGVNPSGACGTPTGSVTIALNGPDNVLYSYFITGPGPAIPPGVDIPFPAPVIPPFAAQAGTYSAIVTDEVSQCSASITIGLTDAGRTVTANALTTCTTTPINVTATTIAFPLDYNVTDQNNVVVASGTNIPAVPFSTAALAPGTYVLEALSSGCTATRTVTISPTGPPVTFSTASDVCSNPQTITATPTGGGVTYSFVAAPGSPVGVASGPGTNLYTIANSTSGSFTYTVTASKAGSCSTDQTVVLNVPTTATPNFVQGDPCADQVLLTASPTGNFIYRWYLKNPTSGTLAFVAAGQQTIVTASGDYVIETNDPVTGCVKALSPAKTVNVSGVVNAGLSATASCDDGKPFTLTATTAATGATFTWFLDGGQISGASDETLEDTEEGVYKVTVTKSTCSASAELEIIRESLPEGNLPDRWTICNDPENKDPKTLTVDLKPGVFDAYNWFRNDLTLNNTDSVLTVDTEGIYKVDITGFNGCVGNDQTIVKNDCEPKIVAPTAFRPSSNVGANKDFYVYSFFITDKFEIFIYNRWGELVYQSDDRYFKWNGSTSAGGNPLPGGTYAYVIKYVSSFQPGKGIQEKHGGVVLLR